MHKQNIIKFLIGTGVAVFLLLLVRFYFVTLPSLIKIDKYRSTIETQFNQKTGNIIKLDKIDLNFTWDFRARIHTNSIKLIKDKEPLIQSDNAKVEVSLLPLILKKVVLKSISADKISADIKRDKDGDLNIVELFRKKETGPKKFIVKLSNSSIIAKTYEIKFDDAFIKPHKNYILEGKSLNITKLTPKKYVKVSTSVILTNTTGEKTNFDGTFAASLKESTNSDLPRHVYFRGGLKNFDLTEFEPYFISLKKAHIYNLKGKLDVNADVTIDNGESKSFFIDVTADKLYFCRGKQHFVTSMPYKTTILTKGFINNSEFFFDTFHIKTKNVDAAVRGGVKDYKKDKKNIDLYLTVENSKIQDILSVFPQEAKIKRDVVNKLRAFDLKADISTKLKIKGQNYYPNLYGETEATNVDFFNQPKDVPLSRIKVTYLGKLLDIDAELHPDKTGVVTVNGSVSPFATATQSINLDINTNIVQLEPTERIILMIRDLIDFQFEPVVDMKLKGTGQAGLKIHGQSTKPTVDGFLSCKNSEIEYNQLSKKASNVNGTLEFKNNKITYKDLTANVEGNKLLAEGYSKIRGNAEIKLTLPNLDLIKGQELINNSIMLKEVKESTKLIKSIKGNADTIILIHGKGDNVQPTSDAELSTKNASLQLVGYSEPFTSLDGKLVFKDKVGTFDKVKAKVAGSDVVASGSLADEKMDLTVEGEKINLEKIRNLIYTSPTLIETQKTLKDLKSMTGFAKAKLVLSGKTTDKNIFKELDATVLNAQFKYADLTYPISLESGSAVFLANSFNTNLLKGSILGSPIEVKGLINDTTKIMKPEMSVKISNVDCKNLKKITNSALVSKNLKNLISNLDVDSGTINADLKLMPTNFDLKLNIDNLVSVYRPTNLPFKVPNGLIGVSENELRFYDFISYFANSKVTTSGKVSGELSPKFDLNIKSNIDGNDFEKYLKSMGDKSAEVRGNILATAQIKGKRDGWKIYSNIDLSKDDKLTYRGINFNSDKNRILKLAANGSNRNVHISSLDYLISKDGDFTKVLSANGGIDNFLGRTQRYRDFNIKTQKNASATLLNPIIQDKAFNIKSGDLLGQVVLNGNSVLPKVTGHVYLSNVEFPKIKGLLSNADVEFLDKTILLKDSSLKIGSSELSIGAMADNVLSIPLIIKRAEINSPSINVDEISKIFIDAHADNPQKPAMPAISVVEGSVYSKELIVNNLITTNFSGGFNFTPDWLLAISNAEADVAGGKIMGEILYNINSSDLVLNLDAKDMQANAFATILLKIPNEIYGNLSGNVQLSTKGTTQLEQTKSANGTAHFDVTSGRLVRLGSLEYLLRAVNVVQCGVTGLTLNNIVDLIVPQQTGHFNTLTGDFVFVDGTIHTDNTVSEGKNLNLALSGTIDMATNNSKLLVVGKLSKKVSGLLGPVGKLSIGSVFDFIPGIGYLPSDPNKNITDLVPQLTKIPLIGINKDKNYRKFAVDIDGNFYQTNAVKSFKWID